MRWILTSRWLHFILMLLVLAGLWQMRLADPPWVQDLRTIVFDSLNRQKPRQRTDKVVIVDLDEKSLEAQGQWPWPRDIVADLILKLNKAGAKVITFDMVFAEPDRTSPSRLLEKMSGTMAESAEARAYLEKLPDNDEIMAQAIKESGNVVMAFVAAREKRAGQPRNKTFMAGIRNKRTWLAGKIIRRSYFTTNIPILTKYAAGNGTFTVEPDIDGVIRKVPFILAYVQPGDGPTEWNTAKYYPTLSLESVRVGLGEDSIIVNTYEEEYGGVVNRGLERIDVGTENVYEIPVGHDGSFYVYYSNDWADDYISAVDIINGDFDPDKIRDKYVLIGTSSIGLLDLRASPMNSTLPGVEIHAEMIEQILSRDFKTRPAAIDGYEAWAMLIAGLMIIILVPYLGAVVLALFSIAAVGGAVFLSYYMYVVEGTLIDPSYFCLSVIAVYLAASFLSFIRTEAEKRDIRQAFGFYIAPDFMEELTADPDKLKLGGETRELTVMFTDVRGFTSISEQLTPEQLIALMNDFLTPMSSLVMDNRGTIDKYMGDAMMAFWNAPLDDADHARHACIAALGMAKALVPVNEKQKEMAQKEGREFIPVAAGVGINTGPCSVGNMGSRQRFAYSALGDTVNLASRLEGQTRQYGVDTIIGEETRAQVPDFATLELDLIAVKGKKQPVHIYALLGDPKMAQSEAFVALAANNEEMIAAYRAQDWDMAEKCAKKGKLLGDEPLWPFYDLYLERIAAYRNDPPGEDWSGVFIATSK